MGAFPFHTEVELKTTFCPLDGVDGIIPLKRRIFSNKSGSRKFFLPGRERSIHLFFGGNRTQIAGILSGCSPSELAGPGNVPSALNPKFGIDTF